jgi:hypothetical protein
MFERLRTLLGLTQAAKPSAVEQIAAYDLSSRPVTKALLLRVAAGLDNDLKWFKEASIGTKSFKEPSNLEEQIDSAVCCAALNIMFDATEKNKAKSICLPGQPLPSDIGLTVAFAFIAIVGMINPLRAEGYDFDFQKACMTLVRVMFLLHSVEEQEQAYRQGSDVFRQVMLAAAEKKNVREWLDSYTYVVLRYLMQWTTDDQKVKESDFPSLFGSLFKSLIASAE